MISGELRALGMTLRYIFMYNIPKNNDSYKYCIPLIVLFVCSDEHSGKVKSFMLDVLCPLITESDNLSNELLDNILINIVEPNKSQRKNAYLLAKELIVKCSDTLESYIQSVSSNVYQASCNSFYINTNSVLTFAQFKSC